jgi:hypothetical protein
VGEGWELEQWLDRQAVEDLICRYSDSVTRGDYEHTATLFAPDAVWEEVGSARFETASAFVDYLVGGSSTMELLIQTPHSPVIAFPAPRQARATTTIREIARGVAGDRSAFGDAGTELAFDRYGIYHDDLEKFEGEWRFTQRIFVPFFTGPGVVGDVSGARPLLRPR